MEVDISAISISIRDFLQNQRSTSTDLPSYESNILTFLTENTMIIYQTLAKKFQENQFQEDTIETIKLNLYNGRYIILKNSHIYASLFYMEMKAAPKKLKLEEILPMPRKRTEFLDFKLKK